MLSYKLLLSISYVLYFNTLYSQFSLNEIGISHCISFEESLSGVNEGRFEGEGLGPNPINGELDSDAWRISGCSDGDTDFSESHISGDLARASSNGSETSGGIYSFNTGNNSTLGWQSTGADLSPGEIILKIQNKSGFSIERMEISYTIWNYNDQNRSQILSCSYSYDDINYFPLNASEFISPTTASSSPIWTDSTYHFGQATNEISHTDFFFLKWRIEDEAGSGSRDEWAIDDIKIRITNNTCLFEGWSKIDSSSSLLSNAGFTLIGVDSYYEVPINFASHSPSARMDDDLDQIISPVVTNAYSMKFWIKSLGNSTGSSLLVEGFDGSAWFTLDLITPLPGNGEIYSIHNLSTYIQFRFTYNKVNGNLAIDDILLLCGTCDLASPPPSISGSISFTSVYCTNAQLAWPDAGAEYYLVLATEKSAISYSPQNHHSYSANASMETGEMVEDSVYVVYNGSENQFILEQLKSNTDYLIRVIPYNGLSCEEYYSPTYIDALLSTPDCTQCPYLLAALINACTENCSTMEGFNEFLIVNSGAHTFPADSSSFKLYFGTEDQSFLNENIVSDAALISTFNSLTDCSTLFIDALSVSQIPMESSILICHRSICLDDIDKSLFCSSPIIYVVLCESDDWNANGEFINSGTTQQNFTLDFRSVSSNCLLHYSYTPNDLPQEDGTSIYFSPSGGEFITFYVSENCSSNLNPLPLSWGDFYASQLEEGIKIEWSTLSEWNNVGFSIERSIEEELFEEIAFLESQGNSAFGFNYAFMDAGLLSGNYMYRLKQVDQNGTYSYSTVLKIEIESDLTIYQNNTMLIIENLEEGNSLVDIFNLQSKCVYSKVLQEKSGQIAITNFSTGIYIVKIRMREETKVIKIYLQSF